MECKECGKSCAKTYKGMCLTCYRYFLNGGTINEKPANGEMKKDSRGFYICHICGRSFRRLGSHVKEWHSMSIRDYKSKFELCYNTRTTSEDYHNTMSELAYKYDMDSQLRRCGEKSRFKRAVGSPRRCSLQECKERSVRALQRGAK